MMPFGDLLDKNNLDELRTQIQEVVGTRIDLKNPSKDKIAKLGLSGQTLEEYTRVCHRLSLLAFHVYENSIELFDFYFSRYPELKKVWSRDKSKVLQKVPTLFEGLLVMTLQGGSCWPEPPWDIGHRIIALRTTPEKLIRLCSPLVNILTPSGLWSTGINHIHMQNANEAILAEHLRGRGSLEYAWKADHKYQAQLENLTRNAEFKCDWMTFKNEFSISDYYDKYGLIRRTIMPERNWRKDYAPTYTTDKDRFQCAFDFFCWKWGLYGMKQDEPLLEKLSHVMTPFGTQIFIPTYWSFDYVRDVEWKKIIRLHRSRGVGKQGLKLEENRRQKKSQLKKLDQVVRKAKTSKIRGQKRLQWIKSQMGFPPRMDDGQLRKLIKESQMV